MKKLLFCFSVILILFLCITINVNAKEVTTFYRYLNVSLGETYETAGVNYQSNVAGTKVVYSENSSFSNAKTINPTETKWHFDKIDTSSDSSYDDFKERFICKAQLNDLQENTIIKSHIKTMKVLYIHLFQDLHLKLRQHLDL